MLGGDTGRISVYIRAAYGATCSVHWWSLSRCPNSSLFTSIRQSAPAVGGDHTCISMQQFNDANFNSDVLQSATPVLVDFFSTGCGQPCNDTLAMLHTLEPQYPTVTFGTLLTNDNPVTTAQYVIVAFPTVIIYNHGVVVNRFNGQPTMAELVAALNALVSVPTEG